MLSKRSGLAAIAIVGAALVAAGCGGSGSSSATSSGALDHIPSTALAYASFDTDFDGDEWKQFDHLATAFDKDFKGVGDELSKSAGKAEGDDDVDFDKDVKPWLGDSAGVAVLST
jgi:hypothetical protein